MLFWTWYVRHARGYRELGCIKEAKKELENIPAEHLRENEVLQEHSLLAQEEGDWKRLVSYASQLAHHYPDDAGGWILWAYGLRRHESLQAAERVLLEALLRHPNDPTIHFNLGCYACCQGDLTTALRKVTRAIALDPQFKRLAELDPDLEALRQTGSFKT